MKISYIQQSGQKVLSDKISFFYLAASCARNQARVGRRQIQSRLRQPPLRRHTAVSTLKTILFQVVENYSINISVLYISISCIINRHHSTKTTTTKTQTYKLDSMARI